MFSFSLRYRFSPFINLSLCISALDIIFSMLFSLLLVNKTIPLCFFLFFIDFKQFLTIFGNFITYRKNKLRLALVIPAGAPIAGANEAIETPPLVADKTSKLCQHTQKLQYIYKVIYSLFLFREFQQQNSPLFY